MQLTPPISIASAVTPSATGCAPAPASIRSRSSCRLPGGGGTGRSAIAAWNAVYSSLAMPGTLGRVEVVRSRGRRGTRGLSRVPEPAAVELGVAAAERHQLGVAAALDQVAGIEDEHEVGLLRGRQPMGDAHGRAPLG